ncbi:MAG: formylmethanofuran dehydrogenase subunit C [Planctomycetaceae bacterium]
MPLVLTLTTKTSIPVEVDTLRLEDVRALPAEAVKKTLVQYGNRQVPLAEFFRVSGSAADDNELVWEGDCSHVKLIGNKLSGGRIRVEGNAGMHLGAEMTGGEITVSGNAGDWVGAEMHGGRITVKGNAGHLIGAVYRGGRKGMTSGEIIIHGDAGNEIGHTMRRGLIVVGGGAGDAIGFGMLAGSILLFGEVGIRHGANMHRGTIALFGAGEPPPMLPTFKLSSTYSPVFLRVYLRYLRTLGFGVPQEYVNAEYQRYCGDFLESGKGEILIRATNGSH